jgi:hypothetical protein
MLRSSIRLPLALFAVSLLSLFAVATALAQPANDDFDNATVVGALPFTDSISTVDATAAPDDPGCVGLNDHTVWYSFTPTANVRATANTFGSDYLTTVSVYTGSRGALTQIACNFNAVAFEASAGTTYYFMVGSCCGLGGGNLVFNVSEAPTVTSLSVDKVDSVTKDGVVTMSGTLACSTATVLSFLEVDLDQVFASRLVAHVADSPPNPVNCSPIASRWQLSTSSETAVRFGPGKAKAQVFAHLLVAGTDFTTSITSTVSLRRG